MVHKMKVFGFRFSVFGKKLNIIEGMSKWQDACKF